MLAELRVQELGVIAALDVVLGPGLTVLTGETGAGKTLVVEALELLLGGRAEAAMVRAGASEAVVEGRFVDGEGEIVLARALPAAGRSRAFVDGRMAPLSALEERGRSLVDLYGQHAHQSLLRPSHQRGALDRFAGVDLSRLTRLRREAAALEERLAALGGDDRQRRRERDLLAFELAEIESAGIASPEEDAELEGRELALADAAALRGATELAMAALSGAAGDAGAGGEGAIGLLGEAIEAVGRHDLLGGHEARLRALQGELEDALHALRLAGEGFEEDPVQLEAVRARRQLLRGLVRKHGDDLAAVLEVAVAHRRQIAELEGQDESRAALEAERDALLAELAKEEEAVGATRREAAPRLGAAVQAHLSELALARARLEVRLAGEGLADDVEMLLGANPGEPLLPLARVASGGELARAMLALRLVLSAGPPTLVFDEVDAGIGGAAALAVGRALKALAAAHQVLVVTHLAQVAAQADHHLVVEKADREGRTVTEVAPVGGQTRVGELSRMLAGNAESSAGRRHAEELLEEARVPSGDPGEGRGARAGGGRARGR